MPYWRITAKTLARILAGTHCPYFEYDPNKAGKTNRKHNKTRNINTAALARLLALRGLRIIGTAGPGGQEPLAEAVIAGRKVRGKPDSIILAVDPSRGHGVIALLEAKSNAPATEAGDTLLQASIYTVPLLPCTRAGCRARLAGGRMEVKTRTGRLLASLRPPATATVNVRRVLVYLAGPQGLEDNTRRALILAGMLARLRAIPVQQGHARVPGPWCTYCRHFKNGTCAVGLFARDKRG